LILVDSSVWVDFFGSFPGRGGSELRRMIDVAEVLQGLTRDSRSIERYLAQWDMIEPRGYETYAQRLRSFVWAVPKVLLSEP
jgi:hypothetical protein